MAFNSDFTSAGSGSSSSIVSQVDIRARTPCASMASSSISSFTCGWCLIPSASAGLGGKRRCPGGSREFRGTERSGFKDVYWRPPQSYSIAVSSRSRKLDVRRAVRPSLHRRLLIHHVTGNMTQPSLGPSLLCHQTLDTSRERVGGH